MSDEFTPPDLGTAARPRWVPRDEAEIKSLIDARLLRETHYLDMKRAATDHGGREIARDLASFALDGGTLLIGIDEIKETRSWNLAPQPLRGNKERIDQIATQLVDPPVFVDIAEVESAAVPGAGYLAVYVPPSPLAPHMVDGVYYGRGDNTRVRLSDAEVLRHHAHRESLTEAIGRLLDEEIARDPVPPDERNGGRLYVVAQPATAPSGVARSLVRDDIGLMSEILREAEPDVAPELRQFSPTPSYASQQNRRARGLAFSSAEASGPGRTFASGGAYSTENDLVDIEFREDGGIRLLLGRITDVVGLSSEATTVIFDGIAVAYTVRMACWARAVGRETGYHGTWRFGLHASGLRGHVSHVFHQMLGGRLYATSYDADNWRDTTSATTPELVQRPREVAERLVGGLLRGLGTAEHYAAALRTDTG